MNERDTNPHRPGTGDEPDARELNRVWDLLDDAGPKSASPEETDAAWADLQARLELQGAAPRRPGSASGQDDRTTPRAWPGRTGSRRRSGGYRGVWLAAAAVAGLLLGATAWYQLPVTHSAAPGEQATVALPDGSVATLNAGSTLRHRRGFALLPGVSAATRDVRLEGEAFFAVEPGSKPFVVDAGRLAVRVVGTRFNVSARPGAPRRATVAVEEGRVEVRPIGRDRGVVLSGGELASLAPGAAELETASVRPERIAAWREGGLTVVDEPLASVLGELSLRYGVEIELGDAAAGSERITVFYPALDGLESVLADLATQQGLSYRRTAEGWEVF